MRAAPTRNSSPTTRCRGQRVAVAGRRDRALHVGIERAVRHLLQRQAVPRARGRRCGARAAAVDVTYRSRERGVEQGRQEHLLHREHGRPQRSHEGGRGHAAGDAAVEGRAQPAGLVVLRRARRPRVPPQHRPRARARSTRCRPPAASRSASRAVFDDDLAKFKNARRSASRGRDRTASPSKACSIYPVDYKAGQKYPLIVVTHGGPAASDRFGFATEIQVYAGEGLRGAAAELSRQHGLRRRVPARHGQGLLQAVASRRDRRHRRRDRDGRGRSRQAGQDGMERRRPHDQQDHHLHRSLQGGQQRRRRGELDLDVRAERSPRVPHAVVRRHAVAGQRADRSVLEPLAIEGRGQGQDADDLPGRRTGSARAAAAVGRDVSRARSRTACRRIFMSRRARATAGRNFVTGSSSFRSRWSGSRSTSTIAPTRGRACPATRRRKRPSRPRPRHNDARAGSAGTQTDKPTRAQYA